VGEGQAEFSDLIRGAMKFDCGALGDFIIMRSDGTPAYNFAVVVDDHLMKITHVIRGEDHLSNTASQILLYKALGFEPPVFAHHSLITGKDRAKLSKRHGSVSVREFRERGFLPEAIINYLSLLGSSFGEGQEIFPPDRIIREFSLEKTGKASAVFDEDKLKWINGAYIRSYSVEELTEALAPFVRKAGYDPNLFERGWLHSVVAAVQGNLTLLADIGGYLDLFYGQRCVISDEAAELLRQGRAPEVIKLFYNALLPGNLPDDDLYNAVVQKVRKESGAKGRELYMPLRAAITGSTQGPELDRIFSILGREKLLKRLALVVGEE
jgi:nondiscriminating glutamyl-tRNA synthetase